MPSPSASRVVAHREVAVRSSTHVREARGDAYPTSVIVEDDAHGGPVEVPADAMSVLIGGQPVTAGLEGWLRRDGHGFLLTGQDVIADAAGGGWWKLSRDPYPLESSHPGVFGVGDLRHGSIKSVASAVGEGALVIALVDQFLSRRESETSASPR
jgi:thioredoxin reductase (NADPH)